MYLKKIKPILPSKRFQSKICVDTVSLSGKNKIKNFFFYKKNLSGRNAITGKIVIFSKGRNVIKKNINNCFKQPYRFYNIFIVYKLERLKNKFYFFIKNYLHNVNIIPAINGVFLGDFFFFNFKNFKNNTILGKQTFLLFTLNNFFFSNINIKNFNFLTKNQKIATSNGTFCFKKNIIIDFKSIIIIMPSKKKKILNWFNTCFIGRNINVFWKYLRLGNFKENFYLGKKQSVRGVAMNPVDHPHGGRTKTNKPEVSPWGWIAKKSH